MPHSGLSSFLVLVEPDGAIARVAFQFPENAKHRRFGRVVAALTDHEDDHDETDQSEILDPDVSTKAYLALSFNPGPKDLAKGFVFGSDPQTCDVLLARDKTSGISGNHFSINVDWSSGNPVIKCLTKDEGTGIHISSALGSIWKL